MFIQEVTDLFSAGQDLKVIDLSEEYLEKLDQKHFDELSVSMPYGADHEFDIVLDVLKDMHGKLELFKPYIELATGAFNIKPDNWTVPDGIDEKFSKYYEMYLVKNEHILENYLMHRVLSEGFPFNYKNESDIMSNYVDLFAKYNLIEFVLTGICRHYMKFDKRRIVDCVSLFTRGYEHSRTKYFQRGE